MNETMPAPVADALAAAKKILAKLGGCALLIGVESYDGLPADKQLHAGRNDVLSYWRVCRRLGYQPEDIRVLTSPRLTRDDILRAERDLAPELHAKQSEAEIQELVDGWLAGEHPKVVLAEATREALIDGVKWLATKLVFTVKLEWEGFKLDQELAALPGFLAYSGHGAQVEGDLALCPRDVGSGLEKAVRFAEVRMLVDAGDDIRTEGTPRPADNLTVVLDCCFAAAGEQSKALRVPTLTPPGNDRAPVAKVEIGSRVFCASGREEQSWQSMLGGRWQSAFTWAFTRALEQWKTAPASGQFKQFKKSTVSHVELLFRSRMLLEALGFPQHPVLVDRLGNLPVFQHDSDVKEQETSAEPNVERRVGQMDPSRPYSYYKFQGLRDGQWLLLAEAMAVGEGNPDLGFAAGKEYWKFNQALLPLNSSDYRSGLEVQKQVRDWNNPPFQRQDVDWVCEVNPTWSNSNSSLFCHYYDSSTAPAGPCGFYMDIQRDESSSWKGVLQWARPQDRTDYLFKNSDLYALRWGTVSQGQMVTNFVGTHWTKPVTGYGDGDWRDPVVSTKFATGIQVRYGQSTYGIVNARLVYDDGSFSDWASDDNDGDRLPDDGNANLRHPINQVSIRANGSLGLVNLECGNSWVTPYGDGTDEMVMIPERCAVVGIQGKKRARYGLVDIKLAYRALP